MISNDISVPWYKNNAKICEVNAQPSLGKSGTGLQWQFLKRYIKKAVEIHIKIDGNINSRTHLYDTEQEKLEISIGVEDVLRDGCPTQYFHSLSFDEKIAQETRMKIENMLVSVMPKYP